MAKKALVFGATGQAGRYLVRILEKEGYEIHGTFRGRIEKCYQGLHGWHPCYLDCRDDIRKVLRDVQPDEVYNLASKMYAPASWEDPQEYVEVNFLPVVTMLEWIARNRPETKFFLAGSAEVFDLSKYPQTEETPLRPRNPYGVAKAAAQELVRVYREQKNLFACTGIFYNMESPLRAPSFFSRKVCSEVARIKRELDAGASRPAPLKLGMLHAMRDWGYTPEYMQAAYMMMQADRPDDYIISTGQVYSCREFVDAAFESAGIVWPNQHKYYEFDKTSLLERDILVGLPLKIQKELGWKAQTHMPQLVKLMVEYDLKEVVV